MIDGFSLFTDVATLARPDHRPERDPATRLTLSLAPHRDDRLSPQHPHLHGRRLQRQRPRDRRRPRSGRLRLPEPGHSSVAGEFHGIDGLAEIRTGCVTNPEARSNSDPPPARLRPQPDRTGPSDRPARREAPGHRELLRLPLRPRRVRPRTGLRLRPTPRSTTSGQAQSDPPSRQGRNLPPATAKSREHGRPPADHPARNTVHPKRETQRTRHGNGFIPARSQPRCHAGGFPRTERRPAAPGCRPSRTVGLEIAGCNWRCRHRASAPGALGHHAEVGDRQLARG